MNRSKSLSALSLLSIPIIYCLTPAIVTAQPEVSPSCPPGKVPLCLCACVQPTPRACESLPTNLPLPSTIRQHLRSYYLEAPESIRSTILPLIGWADDDIANGFSSLLTTARCQSGGAPGPAHPEQVPASQVRAWVLTAINSSTSPPIRALLPLLSALPENVIRIAYLRAVEVKRGLDYGSLK